jgi:hypothetical protein
MALTVAVTSTAYVPLVTLGQNGQLLAADGKNLLYQSEDQTVHVRSIAGDTILASTAGMSQWFLNNGNAFAVGLGPEPGNATLDVFQWAPGGARQDIGVLGASSILARLRVVHYPWVLWSNYTEAPGAFGFTGTYTFYNVTTAQTVTPSLTTPSGIASNIDFYVGPGGPVLYYESDLSANPGTNPVGIYRWDASTAQSTALAGGDLWQLNPETDGTRVAWQTSALGASTAPLSLVTLDIASNAQSTVSTTMNQFQLAGGTLAWIEGVPNAPAIKASDGITVTTVSSLTSARFYGTGGGFVLFGESSNLYVWNATEGRQLLLEATPGVALISGNTVYFTNGVSQTVYSVTVQ